MTRLPPHVSHRTATAARSATARSPADPTGRQTAPAVTQHLGDGPNVEVVDVRYLTASLVAIDHPLQVSEIDLATPYGQALAVTARVVVTVPSGPTGAA
jgi:hypothetical protein